IAAVRPMHDKAPDSTRPKVEGARGGREAVRSPPLRQMCRVGPYQEHQFARCVEHTRADNRTRLLLEIDSISFVHDLPTDSFVSVRFAAPSDSCRGDRAALPKADDIPPAIRRLP